jgi:hypothetical protein
MPSFFARGRERQALSRCITNSDRFICISLVRLRASLAAPA